MDDEDGRCLLDVICDPEALNDFLHGSETHLDADDLLDGSIDPSSSFFSSVGGHVPEVQPPIQLSASGPAGLPSGSVDLDFLEDDDILGGSPGGRGGGSNGFGTDHEPCDILQQSLAEANITEQSLQEAEAELELGSFSLTGLTQVVQTLADPASMTVAGDPAVGMGITVGVGGAAQIFPGPTGSSTAPPPAAATADMLGSVLAHPGLQLQPQVMNKAINVQPFMQQVGLGNVTLQQISGLQALPNGSPSGHLGIGQIQVVGQPTVMTINQPVQPVLAKTVGGYQLHQPGTDVGVAGAQAGLSAPVLSSAGGLLIQGGKAALGSPALNGTGVGVSCANLSSNNSASTITSSAGLVGFSGSSITTGVGAQQQAQVQGQIMQNVIIQRTPTPIQPKPPQGGVIQPKLFRQPQPQPQQTLPSGPAVQNEAKVLGVQQGPVPVSTTQNVAFLTGKAGANVVLSAPTGPQGTAYSQALFKQQTPQAPGKPVSVHLLNQSGSIVIPSQTVLQGQNPQFLLPQLQAGGQILAQHPGGHIITSQGPGGQLIANQILTTNQNLNLSQVLTQQGQHAHILSTPIQLQPGQMTQPALFQMPVSLGQSQAPAQAVIQGMPIQNPLAVLGQVEGLGPAVSLQPPAQQPVCSLPANCGATGAAVAPCPPGEGIVVLGSTVDQSANAAQPSAPPSVLAVQASSSVSVAASAPTAPSSSPSASSSSSLSSLASSGTAPPAQHSPGSLFLTPQGSSMILSQESLQMFLQQEEQSKSEVTSPHLQHTPESVIMSSNGGVPAACGSLSANAHRSLSPSHYLDHTHRSAVVCQLPSAGAQQHLKLQSASPSQLQAAHTLPDTSLPSQASPLVLGQQVQSPHQQAVPSQPPSRPSSRSCTPSSLPPLFLVHNQAAGSPQQLTQVQLPPAVPAQPVTFQQDGPPSSCSPKPPQGAPVQFQIVPPAVGAPMAPGSLQGLTSEQQQTLHLFGAQLQPLTALGQSLPQQNLHQVQQSTILQSKQQAHLQPHPASQFGAKLEALPPQPVTSSASHGTPAQLVPVLQPGSVLVNTQVSIPSEVKVFLGSPGPSVVTSASLAQSIQPKQGVLGSVGGLSLGKGGLHIQVCNSGLAQLTSSQAPPPETVCSKRPLIMEPSKEARMLEQLRKQQGSVLHPDYGTPFRSYRDALQRLLPYHLYQGTSSSREDYRKVDGEFDSVSSEVLKRTRAMLDKYRLLLFEESRRSGPSAEMVMIDRMFIQEEKVTLSQDRVLAKERPDEYVAHSRALESTAARAHQVPTTEASSTRPGSLAPAPLAVPPALYPAATHLTPTKMVIKQGGGTASVTWSSTAVPGPVVPASRASVEPGRAASSRASDDEDALPQRSSKPPMKTYEARRRISLKLKIKQEAGLSKVVHNTALDTLHTPTQLLPPQGSPTQRHQQPGSATSSTRAPPPADVAFPPSHVTTATAKSAAAQHGTAPASAAPPSFPSSFYAPSSSSSSSPSAQVNGTQENHDVGGVRRGPGAAATQPQTTCRLPLRKTYRENVSPQQRPGVPGGGDKGGSPQQPPVPLAPPHEPQGSSSPMAGRTVIASVKLEKRSSRSSPYPATWSRVEQVGPGGGAGATQEQGSSPGLMKELAEVEEVFYHGMIKNAHRHHSEEEEEACGGERKNKRMGVSKSRLGGRKKRERGGGSSKAARPTHSSLSPPAEASCPWDSSLAPKRRSLGSPDMDNASFSSGSPPPDDSLNEHLQRAIDDILNLQQGAAGGSAPRANPSQCPSGAPLGPHRPPVPTSPPVSHHSQLGGASGHGQNSKLVSRTSR